MKKLIVKFITLTAVIITFSSAADAQIRVKIRPSITIGTRPPPPSPRHVWVSGDWNPNGDRYEYRDGYWSEPRGKHGRYKEGRWVHSRHGWIWVPGRWR